jgi:hypothetical protein
MKSLRLLSVLAMAAAWAAPARAQTTAGEQPYAPSIFQYGFNGFLLGTGAGVGAGYLAARAGGWHRDDWQPVAYGATIGALAGGALGLGLGITDMVNETQGRGYYILRDGGYGLGFGVAAGAIVGGLTAIGSKRPERIAAGGAIGGLIGSGAGLVLGIVESQRSWQPAKVALTFLPSEDSAGKLAWMPALIGRY